MAQFGARSSFALGFACLLAVCAGADPPARPRGIYLKATEKGHADGFVRVPATAVLQTRQTGMFKVMLSSGFAKGDVIAVLGGTRASIRASRAAAFRFQLEQGASDSMGGATSLMGMMNGDLMPAEAKSAEDFVLVRFKEKGDSREAQVATYGGRSGRTGRGSKDALPFTTEALGAHVFQVTPREPLPAGEYGFYFAGSQGFSGQIWDFGVD
jgi:hypothetical protein